MVTIDDPLHFVDNHFMQSESWHWEGLNMHGGATALHDIVRRGLRDRDERMARHDLS